MSEKVFTLSGLVAKYAFIRNIHSQAKRFDAIADSKIKNDSLLQWFRVKWGMPGA